MIDGFINILYGLLDLSRVHLSFLPTNIVSASMYFLMSLYGYRAILGVLYPFRAYNVRERVLVFLYAVSILGFLNFVFENFWLLFFYLRYTFFNNGWLVDEWFSGNGYFVSNLYRNGVFMFGFWYCGRDSFKLIRVNETSVLYGVFLVAWLFYLFMLPEYACIDYKLAIGLGWNRVSVVYYYLLTSIGKFPLFMCYRFLFVGDSV